MIKGQFSKHTVLLAYTRMALGLVDHYTDGMMIEDVEKCLDTFENAHYQEYVWDGQPLVREICVAQNITRQQFVRSMAFPKPTPIQHAIYNSELTKRYGEKLPAWDKSYGLIIPTWQNKQITELRLHRLSTLIRSVKQP